jgi:glutamate dehydrogenase (NAD(P)+)
LDDVNQKLRTKMERATDAVLDRQADVNRSGATIDLRTAALLVAIGRVARVALERGIWP